MSEDHILYRIINLKKEYVMGEVTVHALQQVNLEIYRGEFLVILGPSGSGKSTLLNLIGGMETPTEGQLHFYQRDLSTASEHQLTMYRRENIGFVFQFYNLIPNLTAKENVEMATELAKAPADAGEMLGMVGLKERVDHFPGQMSGGEQQLVAIARAVAKRPEILLCDEPTGALDYQTGKVVLQCLQDINRQTGTTLVIITHNAAIADMGDRVVRMRDGQVQDVLQNQKPVTAAEVAW